MTLKRFNSKDREQAVARLAEGVKPREVAERFGVHISTIYELRKERGLGHSRQGRASHVVTLRLTEEEFQALNGFVAETGAKNRSAALRSLVRAATGFLELRRSEYLDLEGIGGELSAQGRNLNQIARALNRSAIMGGAQLKAADRRFLSELRGSFAALEKLVSSALREVRQKGRNALHTGEGL